MHFPFSILKKLSRCCCATTAIFLRSQASSRDRLFSQSRSSVFKAVFIRAVCISGSLLLNGIAFAHLLAFQLERPLRRWRMWTIRERPITPFATYRYTSVKWVNYNYLLFQCYLGVQSRATYIPLNKYIDQISFLRKISDKLFPFHKKSSLHIKNVTSLQ